MDLGNAKFASKKKKNNSTLFSYHFIETSALFARRTSQKKKFITILSLEKEIKRVTAFWLSK